MLQLILGGALLVIPAAAARLLSQSLKGFFWIESLVREDSQRSLLLDMDVAIQRLTTKQADDESLLQLSGVYHNLLRRLRAVLRRSHPPAVSSQMELGDQIGRASCRERV